jgi:hypothetical protein
MGSMGVNACASLSKCGPCMCHETHTHSIKCWWTSFASNFIWSRMEMQKVLAKSHLRPMYSMVGPRDSAVGVAIRWGWAVRGSNSSGSEIFLAVASVPKAHPAPCTVGTGSLPGVKRPKLGAYHSPPSSVGLGIGWNYSSASPLPVVPHAYRLLWNS